MQIIKLPKREWAELFTFALMYAKVCRAYCIEVDEAVNEMMLALSETRWRSLEYAKAVMRNRLHYLIRKEITHQNMTDKYPFPKSKDVCEESKKWDAKLMVEDLLSKVSEKQARTFNHLLLGRTIEEIAQIEGINRSTVHRHIKRAQELIAL